MPGLKSNSDKTSLAKMKYLEEKLNPVLQEMIGELLMKCPSDPTEFMLQWLLEQETFDRGGINSLEDAAAEQAEIAALRKQVTELKRCRRETKAKLIRTVHDERKKRGLPNAPPLEKETVEKIRNNILRAAYIGFQGVDLAVLFSRFDVDGSGELEFDEVKRALRRTLKISPKLVPDHEIHAFCALVDTDYSGTVSIEEFVTFVNDKPKRPK
eukprot:TRINITY_DN110394_c0_g1_i1.p1 TRINITY_DN110394_c0_g1~~TRINITY_DN110394_c0_g1_i1.p1  ORF type:complete len:212 (-),score=57.57 TRINITY_DN110394_c0_g1_i1:68-703(-)